MKDMVSIRKMHSASLATSFGCLEAGVSGAATAALSTEIGDDFFRGDNRLSLAAGSQKKFAGSAYLKLTVKSALTNFGPVVPSELLKTRWYCCGSS